MRSWWHNKWWRRTAMVLGVLLAVRLTIFLWPHRPLSARFPSSTAIYDAQHRLLRLTLASDQTYRLWVPLEQISPIMVEATLLYEDQHFYRHPAVNPVALARAAFSTYVKGNRRIGGSTLSMQLARRIWHIPSRSVGGKLRQIARAIEIELLYSKREILEAYLNLVSYGGNIEGVGAASLIYFHKPVAKLSLSEALSLAVIPQSPKRRGLLQSGGSALPPSLRSARQALFARWLARHPATSGEEAQLGLPIDPHTPAELPFLAPHFAEALLAAPDATATGHEIVSTLDLKLQRIIERHTQGYIARQKRIGISNAAVMLVEVRTGAIKALVGSADYFDPAIDGQVNGALAKRSPGSALKPFIYALGMEQGIIHPLSMLKDARTAFGAYNPENFDGAFVGPINVRDALIRSRNVPAVAVAAKLAHPNLYEFLKNAGVSRLFPESHYGLSLVLGGAEVTMEELLTLYTMLGNRGILRPLKWRKDQATDHSARLLSEEAVFMVVDILLGNPRPDRKVFSEDVKVPVAWKTGTSFGFRDAWAVGLFGSYALAVWVGNFNGAGNPALVGIQAAAPLFFEIIDSLVAQDAAQTAEEKADAPARTSSVLKTPPPSLQRIEVCAVSGQLPSANCHNLQATWFIPGRSPIEVCQIHRAIVIDDRSGTRTCPPYEGPTHTEIFEFWPSDMQRLFMLAGLPRRAPPPVAERCAAVDGAGVAGEAPRITSPLRGVTYALRNEREDRIPLLAIADADVRDLYWFIDESYVGKAKRGDTFLWPAHPGQFTVRAVDDLGRSDARQLRVEHAR